MPKTFQGAISFQNVKFSYTTRPDVLILNNLNLDIPAGSVTAIVGSSGSGKSSIAAILLRFFYTKALENLISKISRLYNCDQGTVTIDGIPVENLEPQSLLGSIGFVTQVNQFNFGSLFPY